MVDFAKRARLAVVNFAAPKHSYLVRFFDEHCDGVTAPRSVEVSPDAGRTWTQWTCKIVEGHSVCDLGCESLTLRAVALVNAAVEDMPGPWQEWASDPEGNTRSLLLAVAVMILKAQELDR